MTELVLVHPFPFDSSFWNAVRAIAPESVRLHTPDLPGFGASPLAPAESLDAMADALHDWIGARRLERFVLGGVSLGGYATFAYLRRFGHDALDGLVLVDTRADIDTAEVQAQRDASIARVRTGGTAPLVEGLSRKLFAPDADAEVVSGAKAIMSRQRPHAVAAALRAMRDRPDSTPLLKTLDLPALVVCGRHDALTPPDLMSALAAGLPRARFEVVEEAGHLVPLERPEAFARLLFSWVESLAV